MAPPRAAWYNGGQNKEPRATGGGIWDVSGVGEWRGEWRGGGGGD